MTSRIGYHTALKRHPIDPETYGLTYAWLEGRQGAMLCHTAQADNGWNSLWHWPEGRIFGPAGEYRWRANNQVDIHAVMILDQGKLPDCFQTTLPLVPEPDNRDHALILWGEWVNPGQANEENETGGPLYYANEIPEAQTYPLMGDRDHLQKAAEQKRTPRLVTRRYRFKPECDASKATIASNPVAQSPRGELVRCVGFDLKTEIEEK